MAKIKPLSDKDRAQYTHTANSQMNERWNATVEARDKRIAELEAVINSGEAFCAYCEQGLFVNDEQGLERLKEHVEKVCPLHPMRTLEARIAELEKTAASLSGETEQSCGATEQKPKGEDDA